MATAADVRRIARSLPHTIEGEDTLAFSVGGDGKKPKGFVWSWKERVHPKKARVENLGVLAVRVADEMEKQMLLASDEAKFFTEPHYAGFPAVLVRLAAVTVRELRDLVTAAWRIQAPRSILAQHGDAGAAKKPKTKR
jgi:hypothetical protein